MSTETFQALTTKTPSFRTRFLDWAEQQGFETPTTADALRSWVADYLSATSDSVVEADKYLARET